MYNEKQKNDKLVRKPKKSSPIYDQIVNSMDGHIPKDTNYFVQMWVKELTQEEKEAIATLQQTKMCIGGYREMIDSAKDSFLEQCDNFNCLLKEKVTRKRSYHHGDSEDFEIQSMKRVRFDGD